MMNFLFDEQFAIENMINMRAVDNDNVFTTIRDVARYNYWVKHMDDDTNYRSVLKYVQQYGQNVNEEAVYLIIDDCVKKAKKYQFKHTNEVCITKGEMQFIEGLNNIKQEKVAFVLLAVAKYYDAIRGTQYHTAYMKNSDICKLARLTIPVRDRDVFMQFMYDCGMLMRHNRAGSIEKRVLIVSEDDDEVVMRLSENDFKDLAYTYLAYKTPRQFRRCVSCGCWMKKDSKDRRLCKECSDKDVPEKSSMKMVQCVECGRDVYVSVFDNETCRCDDCKEQYLKKVRSEQNKRYYEQHKIQ